MDGWMGGMVARGKVRWIVVKRKVVKSLAIIHGRCKGEQETGLRMGCICGMHGGV
jgi:hypothetical protein